MSVRNLHDLFNPASVAVIGASERRYSVGTTVFKNLTSGGFGGAIYPVNPKYDAIAGRTAYARIADLPEAPTLAVICTPPATVPELIGQLGEAGTRAAIVLTAGLAQIRDAQGVSLRQHMLDRARPTLLRVLGPNCVGLLVPGIGLNASFAQTDALPGKLAFVSQSGALVTAVLDWSKARGIGFSRFVSLGESADVDFGDVLDFLAGDSATHAILLYVEDLRQARKFMSAARSAARSKPVVVIKAGRVAEGARAAASHTGALAGADAVYDAAFRRAGMLRVFSTEDLFNAVETLARARPLSGDRLAIMTNGGGPGVMATDALICGQGHLATLSPETLRRLDAVLPPTWSHGNPVDIIGDAPPQRYLQALQALLQDPQADAILFIHAPSAIVSATDIADAIDPAIRAATCPVLACWLGADSVAEARHRTAEAGLPGFDTPEAAVTGFLQLVQYWRNQQLLMQVPPSLPQHFTPVRERVRFVLRTALAEQRSLLSEAESMMLFEAYGIPVVETQVAVTAAQAAQQAATIGFPVALKILSDDISHKSDVGGVTLDLDTSAAVETAANAMHERLGRLQPAPQLRGFTVQAMVRRPEAHELIVGLSTDPVFGPVILFGQGGTAVEVTRDSAIALPPLNMLLARDLVSRTRVAAVLAGYRNQPAADLDGICQTLIALSHLVIDFPEVVELDINPLLADRNGVIALDGRVRIAAHPPGAAPAPGLAIRPYPAELEEAIRWEDAPLLLRPIRPEDAPQHLAFFNAIDQDDLRFRTFMQMRFLQPSQLARLTQIDYDREMAFIATRRDGEPETLGVARAIADPDNIAAEFAIIVRSDLKGRGLGTLLMCKLIDYCRARGTVRLVGTALAHNFRVLNLVRRLGFSVSSAEDDLVQLALELTIYETSALHDEHVG